MSFLFTFVFMLECTPIGLNVLLDCLYYTNNHSEDCFRCSDDMNLNMSNVLDKCVACTIKKC